VLAAWADFSEAIWHYPFYYGLSYTMNSGLSQPFWLDSKAVNTRPWRRGFVNSLRTMGMEDAGEGPGSGRECRARMRLLQEHWHRGMEKLRGAVDAAPPQARRRAESHWRIAASFGYSADTTLRLVRWFDARDKLDQARSPQEAAAALDELEAVGRVELAAAEAALPVYLCDSRLGHFNHGRGCFTALSVVDKIVMLRRTLDEELPALRRARLTTTNP